MGTTTTTVSLVRAERCVNCPDGIELVYARNTYGPEGVVRITAEQVKTSIYPQRQWLHIGGGMSCKAPRKRFGSAEPRTRCPKCQKRGTLVTRQLAWIDETTCTNNRCDYRRTRSIGD